MLSNDCIRCYPHSHHFKNLPLRLTDSSNSVRVAQEWLKRMPIQRFEKILTLADYQTAARGAAHELKQPT